MTSAFFDDNNALQYRQDGLADAGNRFDALDLHKRHVKKTQVIALSQAVASRRQFSCHEQHTRYLDLEPHNHFLVLRLMDLTDFGISKDVDQGDQTHRLGI